MKTSYRIVGKHLKGLGIETKQKKLSGVKHRVLIINESFIDIAKRYVVDVERFNAVPLVPRVPTVPKTCTLKNYNTNNPYKDKTQNNFTNGTYGTHGTAVLQVGSHGTDGTLKNTPHVFGTHGTDGTNGTRDILPFDKKAQIWHQCCYPVGEESMCGGSPCNEYEGMYYCEEHFEKIQKERGTEKT